MNTSAKSLWIERREFTGRGVRFMVTEGVIYVCAADWKALIWQEAPYLPPHVVTREGLTWTPITEAMEDPDATANLDALGWLFDCFVSIPGSVEECACALQAASTLAHAEARYSNNVRC